MIIDINHNLTELEFDNMDRWILQEKILEKNRASIISTLKNLIHFEKNSIGEIIGVDDDEKPKYILTNNQLDILYNSEHNLLIMLKEITDELSYLNLNMKDVISKKNKNNKNNLDIVESIFKKRKGL